MRRDDNAPGAGTRHGAESTSEIAHSVAPEQQDRVSDSMSPLLRLAAAELAVGGPWDAAASAQLDAAIAAAEETS